MSVVRQSTGSSWVAGSSRYSSGSGWSYTGSGAPLVVASSFGGQYRAAGQAISATFGSITPLANDLGIIMVTSKNGARAATPSGWSQLVANEHSSAQTYRQIFTKILGSGESGPSLNQDSGYPTGQPWGYASMVVRGASTTSSISSTPEVQVDTSRSLYVGGLTSPTEAKSLVIAMLSQGNNPSRTVATYYEPEPGSTAKLAQLDLEMDQVYAQATAVSHHIFTQNWPYAGPINWRYFYWSASVSGGAILFVVNPA